MAATLLKRLRSAFQRAADPKKAAQMRSYMKSSMPYHGVQALLVKTICKEFFSDLEFPDAEVWENQVLDLWRNAKFREERYAALNLADHKKAKSFQTPQTVRVYEEMVVTGAWWDYVDDIASHKIGCILRQYPEAMKPILLRWSRSSLWKRRTSIICQLGFKDKTDIDLLYACIAPSLDSSEFFLQKAIGWALREYAKTDAEEVMRYAARHRDALSPLSRREALKHFPKARRLNLN